MENTESHFSNLKDINWQWLRSFLAIARTGTLTAATELIDVSVPTLSRHLQQLEAHLGYRLFSRGVGGYQLNAQGHALFAKVQTINEVIASIGEESTVAHDVRISAGHWTARALNRAFATTFDDNSLWRPIVISKIERDDLARGDVDLGVRNRASESALLASRAIGKIRFGLYRAKDSCTLTVIGYDRPRTPSALWIENQGKIALRVADAVMGIDYLRAGHGQMVLPRFVGEVLDGIECRASIDELTTPQILTMHHENRHQPHIRAAINVTAEVLASLAAY